MRANRTMKSFLMLGFTTFLGAGCGTSDVLREPNPPTISEQSVEQSPDQALLPLNDGNFWRLGATAPKVSVQGTLDGWYEVSGLAETPLTLRTRKDGEIEVKTDNMITTFLKASATSGGKWEAQWQPGACGWVVVTVEKRDTSIPTANGEYHHLTQLSFTNSPQPEVRCRKPVLRRLWLSPGLGVVGVERNNEPAMFLSEAQTARVTFPPAEATVAGIMQDPKLYAGKEVQISGVTNVGDPVCTDALCVARDICCNSCAAPVQIDGMTLIDSTSSPEVCSGNACGFPDMCQPFDHPIGHPTVVFGRVTINKLPQLVIHFTK
jgi:hypothetical protein